MGVIYKLTDDVVAFILERKQQQPDLSCRELVGAVFAELGRVVSKSSVHEVLKGHNVVSPRGRKAKIKFQIPDDKKAQIIASMPPEIKAVIPAPLTPVPPKESENVWAMEDAPLTLRVEPMVPQIILTTEEVKPAPPLVPLEESLEPVNLREFFMEAAFMELFPNAGAGIHHPKDLNLLDPQALQKEKAYRLMQIASYKITLQDESAYVIDARSQRIARDQLLPTRLVPIESAINRMADTVVNNIRPLIIREIKGDFLDAAVHDLFGSMQHVPQKMIERVSLLDAEGEALVDITPVPHIRRNFIVGVMPANKDVQSFIEKPWPTLRSIHDHCLSEPLMFFARDILLGGQSLRALTLLQGDQPVMVVITNMSKKVDDADILKNYVHAHPILPTIPVETNAIVNQENMIEAHATYLFGHLFNEDHLEQWAGLRASHQYNGHINCVSIIDRTVYERSTEIKKAAELLNYLDIADQQGRKLWVCVA